MRFFLVFTLILSLRAQVTERTDATPQEVNAAADRALQLLRNDKTEEALMEIRGVIKSDMTNLRLRLIAGHCHWRSGNAESAATHFRTAIENHPDNPGASVDYALFLFSQNKFEKAGEIALAAINRTGDNSPAKLHNIRARAALRRGAFESALVSVQAAKAARVQEPKDLREALELEARAQLALGAADKARLAMEWSLSLRQDNPYAQNFLGVIHERLAAASGADQAGHLRQARELYQKALASQSPEGFRKIVASNLARVSGSGL